VGRRVFSLGRGGAGGGRAQRLSAGAPPGAEEAAGGWLPPPVSLGPEKKTGLNVGPVVAGLTRRRGAGRDAAEQRGRGPSVSGGQAEGRRGLGAAARSKAGGRANPGEERATTRPGAQTAYLAGADKWLRGRRAQSLLALPRRAVGTRGSTGSLAVPGQPVL
jgi:hypothetical protein